jgi:hypothetical protein
MNTRLTTLIKRFANAKADVDASNREIREASARKLTKLLALPNPAGRVAGLKDPALTPYDRDRLAQAIADQLPRRRLKLPRPFTGMISAALRQTRYRWRGLLLLGLVLIPVMALGAIAVFHTGQSKRAFNNGYQFSWTFADGHVDVIPVAAGAAVVVAGRRANGDVVIRYWSADEGYGFTVVSADTFDRITNF